MREKCPIILGLLIVLSSMACTRQGQGHAGTSKPFRVSGVDVDAAEPAIAGGPDGTTYVAWVEHGPNGEADVMLSQFDRDGRSTGSAARVNPQAGGATAWRGDPPPVAVASNGTFQGGWTDSGAEQSQEKEM
jgi:hypothetical protein